MDTIAPDFSNQIQIWLSSGEFVLTLAKTAIIIGAILVTLLLFSTPFIIMWWISKDWS